MKQEGRIEAGPGRRPPGLARLALFGTPVVFVAYAIAIGLARELPFWVALAGSVANTVPTMLFALVAYRIIAGTLVRLPLPAQIAGHALLGAAYAVLTYWLLMVLLGILHAQSVIQFTVAPFPTRASVWQLLQNVTVYGLVAALAYLHARPEAVALILSDRSGEEPSRPLSRYFIRSGDEIRPVDVAAIVSIAGADDYAEVATAAGRHLVKTTLSEFEKALDPERFIRVHRSRIVNVERIERAEPAGGGRLLLHMEDGETIAASRSGSRRLRDRVI